MLKVFSKFCFVVGTPVSNISLPSSSVITLSSLTLLNWAFILAIFSPAYLPLHQFFFLGENFPKQVLVAHLLAK